MYATGNPKTKKQLKQWVLDGRQISIFQVGPFGGNEPKDVKGQAIEGPHFPEPHRWYAQVDVVDGVIVAVK